MNTRGIGIAVAYSLLATGCAAVALYGLEPGRSSEGDVRRALGEPAKSFAAADGSRTLVFPTGPYGTQTNMARLAPDGRLLRVEQVLSEDYFSRIANGQTTSQEVERLIGPPWRTIDFPNLRQVAWDYRFLDAWGYTTDLSVMIDERGIVAGIVKVRVNEGRNGGRE